MLGLLPGTKGSGGRPILGCFASPGVPIGGKGGGLFVGCVEHWCAVVPSCGLPQTTCRRGIGYAMCVASGVCKVVLYDLSPVGDEYRVPYVMGAVVVFVFPQRFLACRTSLPCARLRVEPRQ